MYKIILFRLFEPRHLKGLDKVGKAINLSIVILIILNCFAIALETFDKIYQPYIGLFKSFEIFSVIIFSIEYLLRLWTSAYNPKLHKNGDLKKRFKYALSPLAIIDLVAILPFYFVSLGVDLRTFRVLRTFRLFKLGRYTDSAAQFWSVIIERKNELIISVFFSGVLMFISSFIVYLAENPVQPDRFTNIFSGFAWAIATLTPGPPAYEFAKPITNFGIFAAGLLQILGIAIIALPTGIIGGGFADKLKQNKTGISLELKQYKKMKENKLISAKEYEKKKMQLIEMLVNKPSIVAERIDKLEEMKNKKLISDGDYQANEKKLLKETQAHRIETELLELKSDPNSDYKNKKKQILDIE